jgi:hypothetical protein
MRTQLRSTVAGLGVLACGIAHANLIANGSFESGSFTPPSNATMTLSPGSTALTGWQVVNDSLAWIGVGDPWGLDAQDGDRFLDLSDYSAGAPFGGVQQGLSTNLGYEYTVTFYLGSSNIWGRPASLTVSAAGQSGSFESLTTGTNNDWQQFSFKFVANSTNTTLSFVGASGVNYIGLDNVVATVTAVPEPTTTVLWLAGIAALGLRMSRVRRTHNQRTCR